MLKGRDETHGGLVAVKIWGEPVVSGWKTFEIPCVLGGNLPWVGLRQLISLMSGWLLRCSRCDLCERSG